MSKTAEDYEDQYTKPQLRADLKEKIKAGDKGGKPGQWSARKSQLLAHEYEKQGGGYKDEKTDEQKSLEEWTNEDWQTKEGDANAAGGEKRYLPEKAWDLLSHDEKKKAEQKKRSEARQYVENTAAAKAARKYVSHDDASELSVEQLERLTRDELDDLARDRAVTGRSKMDKQELAHVLHDSFSDDKSDADGQTKDELYEQAKKLDISGRSKMDKDELADAVAEAE
jgi:hypothetical protein